MSLLCSRFSLARVPTVASKGPTFTLASLLPSPFPPFQSHCLPLCFSGMVLPQGLFTCCSCLWGAFSQVATWLAPPTFRSVTSLTMLFKVTTPDISPSPLHFSSFLWDLLPIIFSLLVDSSFTLGPPLFFCLSIFLSISLPQEDTATLITKT